MCVHVLHIPWISLLLSVFSFSLKLTNLHKHDEANPQTQEEKLSPSPRFRISPRKLMASPRKAREKEKEKEKDKGHKTQDFTSTFSGPKKFHEVNTKSMTHTEGFTLRGEALKTADAIKEMRGKDGLKEHKSIALSTADATVYLTERRKSDSAEIPTLLSLPSSSTLASGQLSDRIILHNSASSHEMIENPMRNIAPNGPGVWGGRIYSVSLCLFFFVGSIYTLIHSYKTYSQFHTLIHKPRTGSARGFMEYVDEGALEGKRPHVTTIEGEDHRSKIFDFFGEGDRGKINQFLDRTTSTDNAPAAGGGGGGGGGDKKVFLTVNTDTSEGRNRKVLSLSLSFCSPFELFYDHSLLPALRLFVLLSSSLCSFYFSSPRTFFPCPRILSLSPLYLISPKLSFPVLRVIQNIYSEHREARHKRELRRK